MEQIEANFVVKQNAVVSTDYSDNSFVGCLHEKCLWDEQQFEKLSHAILFLTQRNYREHRMPELVFDIYSYIVGIAFVAHAHPNDCYRIKNIGDDQFWELRNQVEILFRGFLGSQRFK